MDIRMPEMDGLEATQQIRQLQDPSEDPVVIIALTASIFEEEHQEILTIGCNDWVRKPFRQEVILAKIAEYLGVVYVYETKDVDRFFQADQLSSKNHLLHTDQLNGDHLKAMSPEWRSQLREAAICARDQRLFRLIDEIPPEHSPLANVLVDLVNNFRYDKIMDLIQRGEHE
jgi:response regulator RpfG family c-di-GMP phosphodiesterase